MRNNGDGWYFCVRHHRAEPPEQCRDVTRLGPYASAAEAETDADRLLRRQPQGWYGRHQVRDRERTHRVAAHDPTERQRPRDPDRSWDDDMWDDGT